MVVFFLIMRSLGGEKKKMANEQNLNKEGFFKTNDEATKDAARKGGIASGKKRRLQGAIERALESKASSEEYTELFETFGLTEEDGKTFASAVACALVKKAANGDLSAISLIRDTIGEKPKEEIDLNGGVVIFDDITTSH